ncbi:MAG: hypothetical protein Q8O72_09165 [Bacteroidales bacterium]|nr:hypothetical protein [Bacteroidales bacterium]
MVEGPAILDNIISNIVVIKLMGSISRTIYQQILHEISDIKKKAATGNGNRQLFLWLLRKPLLRKGRNSGGD